MSAEIFRFMTIRPPQAAPPGAAKNIVDLTTVRSDLLGSLAEKKKADSREGMEKIAKAFVARDASFIDLRRKVDPKFLAYHEAVLALEEQRFGKVARERFARILGSQPSAYVDGNEFRKLLLDLAHSIVVAAIDQGVSSKVRSLLVGLARSVGLVLRLAKSSEKDYARADYFEQIILLPEGIFPLPTTKQDLAKQQKEDEERRNRQAEDRKKLVELSEELTANRGAIDEILTTYEKTSFKPGRAVSVVTPPADGATGPGGFVLSDREVAELSPDTTRILKKAGLEGTIDVARTTSLIEKRSSEISKKLYTNRNAARYLVNIGSGLVSSDAIVAGGLSVFQDPVLGLRHPGPCALIPASEANEEVTVPLWTTHGEARALGFADLMLVEQELLRYELGEIAHIENVLIGELREREFRTATTTERSTTTETETAEETTKDLTSTERFELQTESESVISENTSTQAGVTVNASYGPSIDVTANFNYTNNTAKESSNRASSSFAQDTTSKATSKIQKRTLERRFTRTLSETEEKNKHSFRNRESDAKNISGVYRFVDKIYKAQIVNYGKRFMLEFVVPEPAAFLRHAMTLQPAEGISQTKPDEPGYCTNGLFVALQPQDISQDNYLFWASKYLAEDVTPPPSNTQIVSGVVINDKPGAKSQFTEDIYDAVELKDLKIPDGYKPTRAIVTAEGWNVATVDSHPAHLCLQIQKEIVMVANQAVINVTLESDVTDKIPISVVAKNYEKYAVVANVFCVRTREKYEEWQIKTYVSIMTAYNELKTRYDNALEALGIESSFTQISGTNPLANREREKTELKKGCIALLTGQNFEEFDSVRRNVAPHGYPEMAFADAQAEGRYIQFFENAFEWVNMSYIFYPYFWGKKDDWVTISQIADTDPLYERFLQAGAARVQVPVRAGFEISLTNFLGIRSLWFGEGTLLNPEDEHETENLYLSVLDELKEQLGNQNVEGKGRLTVKKNDEVVTGSDTGFTQDDELKRIVIKGKTYIMKEIVSATEIRLNRSYAEDDESGVRYSMGAKLIGEPWEVKLPTNLVMIESDGQSLIVS